MVITSVDFTKGENKISSVFLVVSADKQVLMTIDVDEMHYDSIHTEYVNIITFLASEATDTAVEYFEYINQRMKQLMNATIYKVSLHKNIYEDLIHSEKANDFKSWEEYTTKFSFEEIKDNGSSDNQDIESLQMY